MALTGVHVPPDARLPGIADRETHRAPKAGCHRLVKETEEPTETFSTRVCVAVGHR